MLCVYCLDLSIELGAKKKKKKKRTKRNRHYQWPVEKSNEGDDERRYAILNVYLIIIFRTIYLRYLIPASQGTKVDLHGHSKI